MTTTVDCLLSVARGEPGYPLRLERLGAAAPESIDLHGNRALLDETVVALFCSVTVPGSAVVEAYDVARELSGSGHTIAGGFQSPLEREMLDYLLRGSASVIICPARGLRGLRIPSSWRPALRESRLLLLSSFPPEYRRPTLATADLRNRVTAALASRMILLHASSGGRLARLAREALTWGIPVQCLDHPSNEDLRVTGAQRLPRTW